MKGFAPVLLLGGQENALSITRSLGGRGVPIWVTAETQNVASLSRYCRKIFPYTQRKKAAEHWGNLLLGERPLPEGTVVLATSDDGIEFLARNDAALRQRYILDQNDAAVQLIMLDKKNSLRLAKKAGVATPAFWDVDEQDDVDRALPEVCFPALIKPIHSHIFQRLFGKKHFITGSRTELRDRAKQVLASNIPFMICEMIPGPDTLLSSYYTYITGAGEELFRFTKRVYRRYPNNQGGASYHATEWLPETAKAGQAFFFGMNFLGLGNVEFKLDRRDGLLKLIECNARFTAAQELLVRSGVDTGWLVYCHLTGRPIPTIESYQENLTYWYPERDYNAFRQLHRMGRLSTLGWLKSIARPQVTPYHRWDDPKPGFTHLYWRLSELLARHRSSV